jgi:hypothetical protein
MWQFEWMVNLLPTWVFHFIVITGIVLILASWILKHIPFINQYNFPVHLIGILLTVVGIYYEGGRGVQAAWEAKAADMVAKIKTAESKSQQVNTVIETKIVERVKIVKDTKNANKETAKLIANQLDSKCVVPESTVMLINSASQNEVARGASSTDGSASNVRASDVVETVIENYGRYNELREKVIGWQNWYLEQKKIFEGVTK